MPVKIRLARHGKKGKPFYHIVVADSRAPRDGKFIERIGSYNPNTNPASMDIQFDRALTWLQNGAQPTDTCKAILSFKGVLMKKHLLEGVKKGAFTEEVAIERFDRWMSEKENNLLQKKDKLAQASKKEKEKKLTAEQKVSQLRAQALAQRNAAVAAEEAKPAEEPEAESPAEESAEA
jgi:small subunit ribosomal protein S16